MEKVLNEKNNNEEKVLSKIVFDLYMSSNDINMYNEKIRALIIDLTENKNKMHKTFNYLKQLLEEYVRKYATDNEKTNYCLKRKTMKTLIPSYVKFCDDLFNVSAHKRCEYLVSKNISVNNVKNNFEKYKKRGGIHYNLLDDFYKEYSLYMTKYNYKLKSRKSRVDYRTACEFFDKIVELGFYNISDYIDYLDPSKREICYNKAIYTKKIIINHNPEKWESYKCKMERNKVNTYIMMKDKIDEFMEQMINGYYNNTPLDVIDYYMIVGIPFKKFKEICFDHFTNSQMALFNIFSSSYANIDEKNYDYNNLTKINYKNNKTEKYITEEEKIYIINFLREYNIPPVYFPLALNKYLKGNLDIKFKSLKKNSIN